MMSASDRRKARAAAIPAKPAAHDHDSLSPPTRHGDDLPAFTDLPALYRPAEVAARPLTSHSWSLLGPNSGRHELWVAVSLPQLLFVEFADTCLGKFIDKQDLVRDSVLRNRSRFGEGFQMCLDFLLAECVAGLGTPDDERERPFLPICRP